MSKRVVWAMLPDSEPSQKQIEQMVKDYKEQKSATANNSNLLTGRFLSRYYGRVTNKDIGILSIAGGLYSEPSWCGNDYKEIALSLEQLEQDEDVKQILIDINSPGGSVSGLIELCSLIKNCSKPTHAYIEGMGASAAYGIATAVSGKIFTTLSSEVGSVGVMGVYYDDTKFYEDRGTKILRFFSKNSKKKNLNPTTEEGEQEVQKDLDETEDLFVGMIASNRGLGHEEVISKFGQGLLFRGKEAMERGLVDVIVENIDACVNLIKSSEEDEGEGMAEQIKSIDALTTAYPELVTQIKSDERTAGVEEGRKDERARVGALVALTKYTSDMSIISSAIKEGKTADVVMSEILEAQLTDVEKNKREALANLEKAAGETEKNSVKTVPLSSDGLLSDDKEAREKSDRMAENIKGSK